MKFSEILKKEKLNHQNSFLLWMIYAWPIFSENHNKILAYSAYRFWDRSEKSAKYSIDEYYNFHIEKFKSFLWSDYSIKLNSDIKKLFWCTERLQNWVSVIIDFDFNIPNDLDKELYIYWLIEKWLIDIDENHKKTFLCWVMDGRWSLDFSWKFFSLDIARKDKPDFVKRKLNKYNDIIGAVFNYNPRLAQEKSFKKNDQFRLPLNYYMWNFWLFTPFKIDYYKNERNLKIDFLKEWYFLIDKNYENIELDSTFISDRNLKINELAIKLKKQDLSEEEKRSIIDEYKMKNMTSDSDDEILYSSQNIKEMAKKIWKYKCEFNENHISFKAKTNNENYVEAHHLIPFSERKNFDLSIDVIENMVCLCPNCHRKIHLAIDEEKIELIRPIFERKKWNLHNIWININETKLLEFYKIWK